MFGIKCVLECVGEDVKCQHQNEHQHGGRPDLPEETGNYIAVVSRVANHDPPTGLAFDA